MSTTIHVSETINRPISEVFHFYADEHVRNHPRWDPDMQLEQITSGPIGVGTVISRRNNHTGTPVEGKMEVVEFERDQAMSVVIREGQSETKGRVIFKANSEGQTTIAISAEFEEMDGAMEELIAGLMQRSAGNIKELVESED